MRSIPFNIPYVTGREKDYLADVLENSKKKNYTSYKNRCVNILLRNWDFKEIHLTNSCTSALEISSILIDTKPGDEIIIPSWTFPSTANAFIRHGAKIILADSRPDHPGIEEEGLESLVSERTKAIVPVHYGGIACNLDNILKIADKYNLVVIEDAAHCYDGYYKGKQLGSIGNMGCLSFHRSKNLQCEEGGAIIINDKNYSGRINNILQKGTNRQEYIEGKKEKYEWVDIGSSFGMSELHASYLYAQLEVSSEIRIKRKNVWNEYYALLSPLQSLDIGLPFIPEFADHNAHIFFLVLESTDQRNDLITFLAGKDIEATTHYTPLHLSEFWRKSNVSVPKYDNCQKYHDRLLRLPLYNAMTLDDVRAVCSAINDFFNF